MALAIAEVMVDARTASAKQAGSANSSLEWQSWKAQFGFQTCIFLGALAQENLQVCIP